MKSSHITIFFCLALICVTAVAITDALVDGSIENASPYQTIAASIVAAAAGAYKGSPENNSSKPEDE